MTIYLYLVCNFKKSLRRSGLKKESWRTCFESKIRTRSCKEKGRRGRTKKKSIDRIRKIRKRTSKIKSRSKIKRISWIALKIKNRSWISCKITSKIKSRSWITLKIKRIAKCNGIYLIKSITNPCRPLIPIPCLKGSCNKWTRKIFRKTVIKIKHGWNELITKAAHIRRYHSFQPETKFGRIQTNPMPTETKLIWYGATRWQWDGPNIRWHQNPIGIELCL